MGIGTKLLSEIDAFGEETQSKGILIETTVSNTGAQKLYECNGYQKVTERFFYERKNKPKRTRLIDKPTHSIIRTLNETPPTRNNRSRASGGVW
jgi:ribosomal protein S18 acetylase RimI-like enzyme